MSVFVSCFCPVVKSLETQFGYNQPKMYSLKHLLNYWFLNYDNTLPIVKELHTVYNKYLNGIESWYQSHRAVFRQVALSSVNVQIDSVPQVGNYFLSKLPFFLWHIFPVLNVLPFYFTLRE